MSVKQSQNIYLIGVPGAGKSTIGRYVAQSLKMPFYDSDIEVEKQCGADIAWIFDVEGEQGFRAREEKAIHELTQLQGVVVATGGGVALSEKNRTRLAGRGTVFYLRVPIDQQLERVAKDQKRPLLNVDAYERQSILENLNNEREPQYMEIADYVIDTGNRGIQVVGRDIVRMINMAKSQ